MNISTIDSEYSMNYNKKELNRIKLIEEENNISKVEEIKEDRILSNEEVRDLLYINRASQIMKSLLEIQLDEEKDTELKYMDIRDLQKLKNRIDVLEYYKNEVRIQVDESKFEEWV